MSFLTDSVFLPTYWGSEGSTYPFQTLSKPRTYQTSIPVESINTIKFTATRVLHKQKKTHNKSRKSLILLVRPAGFEPATYGLEVSIEQNLQENHE